MFEKKRVTFPVFVIVVTLTSGGIGPYLTAVAAETAFFLVRSLPNKSFAYLFPTGKGSVSTFFKFFKFLIFKELFGISHV